MSSRSGSNSFKLLFISELWIASVQSMLVTQHSLFYETLYFGRISKLEKSCQNNTKSSFMCFAQILKCLHFIKFYVLLPTSVCMYMCVCVLCTDGPQIMTAHLNDFSTLRWCMFSGDHTLNFEFWSFVRLGICGVVLSHDAGWGQQATAPCCRVLQSRGQQPAPPTTVPPI